VLSNIIEWKPNRVSVELWFTWLAYSTAELRVWTDITDLDKRIGTYIYADDYISPMAQSNDSHPAFLMIYAKMTKDFLECLPIELIFSILDPDTMLSHQQGGFACASQRALQLSNKNLARLTTSNQTDTFMSTTGQWTAAYRKLSPELQQAVIGTIGVLPCPVIMQGMSDRKSKVYVQTWSACQWLLRGDMVEGERCLETTTDAARGTGVPLPYTSVIMRNGWQTRLHVLLVRRDSALRTGLVELSQILQEEAVQAAYHANVSAPSFECKGKVSWAQAIAVAVENMLLTPSLILQSLWRYSFLL
jgi:hypothetical protein